MGGTTMTKPFTPVPKPVSTKKSKTPSKSKASALPSKSVDMAAVEAKKTRREQNARNRDFGKETERRVAKKVGGERIPMSGAIKQGNFNLTGDVRVRDALNNNMMKLEIKASSSISAKGEKQINIKLDWLKQMVQEAREAHEIGALTFHFKGESEEWYIFTEKDILDLIELAKLGCLYEATIEKDNA
jgi:hypothetical protein